MWAHSSVSCISTEGEKKSTENMPCLSEGCDEQHYSVRAWEQAPVRITDWVLGAGNQKKHAEIC